MEEKKEAVGKGRREQGKEGGKQTKIYTCDLQF